MPAFIVLGTLSWKVLLLFIVQMLVITTVLRGMGAVQYWIHWQSWSVSTGYVVAEHAFALVVFAFMTGFVNAGEPPQDFPYSLFHSVAVLWPLQAILLAGDLLIRALHARQEADS